MSFQFEEQNISAFLEKVRSTGTLLIVKISTQSFYENLFESDQLKAKILENNAVTIGIEFPSKNYDNFASFYKIGTPPLICFIAPNGVVIEVVRGEISQEYFIKVLTFALSNIGRGKDANEVYYPFNEIATLPLQEQKSTKPLLESTKPLLESTKPLLETTKPQILNMQKEKPLNSHKPRSTVPKLCDNTPTKVINNICRIKFTLPDGSHISNTFESTSTLAELRLFLLERIPGIKDFVIIRPHPREEFQSTQNESTLRELDIPTGSGLVIRVCSTEIAKMPISIWPFFAAIISFFASIFSYFFPVWSNSPAPVISTTNQRTAIPTAKSNTSTRTVGRRGNMYRLSDLKDRDDDNNTYNGNSTQQQ